MVLSYLSWLSCVEIEVLGHMLYNNLLGSSLYLSGETQDKDSLSEGIDEASSVGMSWKVASSMQIVVDGPWSNGLPPFGYSRVIFFFCHSSF